MSCVASTGPAGSASASSVAPAPERSRMWPRSPARPSEMSIAAWASPCPASARPSATRGVGRCMRCAACASASAASGVSPRRPASASRASPSVPETQMSSPARAASRRSARLDATSPKIVMQMFSGPFVVSPPISSQPWASASANRPPENARSQSASATGNASANVNATGRAPIAARSDRLTARLLWPSRRGSSPAKKWRSSTSMSDEIAMVMPGVGRNSAQSSPMPSSARPAPGRTKNCLIRSNSESMLPL